MKTDIDGLAAIIQKELSEYSQDVADKLKEEVKIVAKECKAEIVANSPKKTGKYKKGWAVKKLYEGNDDIRVTVHNRTRYMLTSLLEFGHAKTGGGRVEGKPHIRPAELNAAKKLENRVKVVVKG